MASKASSTVTAALETDEQSARKVGVLVAEGFAGDELAVILVETGPGAWRVIPTAKGRKCDPESKTVDLKDAEAAAVDFSVR